MSTRNYAFKKTNPELRALIDLILEYEPRLNESGLFLAKQCAVCNEIKPLDEYMMSGGTANRHTYCRTCYAEYQRNHRQQSTQPPAPLFDTPTAPEPNAPVTLDDKIARIRMMSGE